MKLKLFQEQKKTCASNKVEEALRQIEVKILTRLNCAEQQEYSKNSFLIERMHDSLACIVPKNGKLEKVKNTFIFLKEITFFFYKTYSKNF